MATRQKLKLTVAEVKAANKPGYVSDGDGLYLQVLASGSKYWVYRFRWSDGPGEKSRTRELGLGSLDSLGLRQARDASDAAKAKVRDGINPIEERAASRGVRVTRAAPEIPTLRTFGLKMIDHWAPGWKSTRVEGVVDPRKTGKQKQNWTQTIEHYAVAIADKPIADIGSEDILTVLRPLWRTKQETANKTRRRLEKILAAARVDGLRLGDNPARWKDHLEFMLPKPRTAVRHHPAMPYQDIPAFMVKLREKDSRGARALEFLLFTMVRTSEVIFAEKAEVDYIERTWTIPGARMKGTDAEDHIVPLSEPALKIAARASGLTPAGNPYIFGTLEHRKPLSTATMDKVLQVGLGYTQYTVHGFRSSFSDWAGDETDHEEEVAERSLAHARGDATAQAYRRARALKKRRRLMDDWAAFLESAK